MRHFFKIFLPACFSAFLILESLSLVPAWGQTITTVVGNCTDNYTGDGGPATLATLWAPDDIAFDSAGNYYIADAGSNTVRKVNIATGVISTYAGLYNPTGLPLSGDGGPATLALLCFPSALAFDSNNNLYIADFYNSVIREVNAATGIITTFAGNGTGGYSGDGEPATLAEMANPNIVRFDPGGILYVSDAGNNTVRKINMTTGIITTVAGTGIGGFSGNGGPATLAEMNQPEAITFDSLGNLYISDCLNAVIREVNAGTGIINTVVGTGVAGYSGDGGPATLAQLNNDIGSVTFACNGDLLLTDDFNNRVRMVDKTTGIITTVIGTGVSGCSTSGTPLLTTNISHPEALAFDSLENLYLVDYDYSLVQVATGLCPGTPTPTPSSTCTFTSTRTPTPTSTPTITHTPTWTPTNTATGTPTFTGTPTSSFTPTNTPTMTLTPSWTPTATPTHSATHSPTSTPTSSATVQATGQYMVNVGVYNEAGELIDQVRVVQLSQSVDSLTLQGDAITGLTGPNGQIDIYSQGNLLGIWNGRGFDGNPVSNGVYFIKVNSVDPFGVVSTVTQQATVSRSLAKVSVNVFNEAGEVVKHLLAWVDDPLGTEMTNVVLSSSALQPGAPASSGQASTVQIVVQTSEMAVTLSWDGTNDNGSYVTAGDYLLGAQWFDGQGGTVDISKDILVTANGHRNNGTLVAQPNILTPSKGVTRTTFRYYSGFDLTLRVRIYNLAGELTSQTQGESGTNQAIWDATGYASGLYLAVVDLLNNNGGQMGQQILKIMVLR